jgi:hypothetical protein
MQFFGKIFFFVFSVAIFSGCGMEEYYYLPQIPEGNIEVELNTKATIRLPNINTSTGGYYYFKNFTIFYRIYVSGLSVTGKIETSSDMNSINSYLNSDYTAIYPSADSTNSSVNTSIATLFKNRNYYELALDGTDIRNALSDSSLGSTIVLDFSPNPGRRPTFDIDGIRTYSLYRSNGENTFSPEPDRYFLNSNDLNKAENLTPNSQKNADVANVSSSPAMRYTYVSMYIAVTGMDNNYTTIYSKPTFIGILKLPEA